MHPAFRDIMELVGVWRLWLAVVVDACHYFLEAAVVIQSKRSPMLGCDGFLAPPEIPLPINRMTCYEEKAAQKDKELLESDIL